MPDPSTADPIARTYAESAACREWSANQDAGLEPFERILVERHGPDTEAHVCVVGCASGRETFALYRLGYRNITGIDICESFLEVARARAARDGLPIRFTPGRTDAMPFPDASLGLVTMFGNVFAHVTPAEARRASLAEVHRVLRPGGVVLLDATSLHHRYAYLAAIRILEVLRRLYNPCRMERGDKVIRWERDRRKRWSPQAARSHWFRPGEIPEMARQAGMETLQASTVKGLVARPDGDCRQVHGGGRLVYALRRKD